MIAWVPPYQLLFVDKKFSEKNPPRHKTFNQNLIAMRARTWLNITGYQGNLTNLVKSYEKIYEGANLEFGSWWYDQIITTHALLASKICTVPEDRWVWRMFSLKHDPLLVDKDTCWHGQGYLGCNAWSGKSYKVRNIFRIIRFKPILMNNTHLLKDDLSGNIFDLEMSDHFS